MKNRLLEQKARGVGSDPRVEHARSTCKEGQQRHLADDAKGNRDEGGNPAQRLVRWPPGVKRVDGERSPPEEAQEQQHEGDANRPAGESLWILLRPCEGVEGEHLGHVRTGVPLRSELDPESYPLPGNEVGLCLVDLDEDFTVRGRVPFGLEPGAVLSLCAELVQAHEGAPAGDVRLDVNREGGGGLRGDRGRGNRGERVAGRQDDALGGGVLGRLGRARERDRRLVAGKRNDRAVDVAAGLRPRGARDPRPRAAVVQAAVSAAIRGGGHQRAVGRADQRKDGLRRKLVGLIADHRPDVGRPLVGPHVEDEQGPRNARDEDSVLREQGGREVHVAERRLCPGDTSVEGGDDESAVTDGREPLAIGRGRERAKGAISARISESPTRAAIVRKVHPRTVAGGQAMASAGIAIERAHATRAVGRLRDGRDRARWRQRNERATRVGQEEPVPNVADRRERPAQGPSHEDGARLLDVPGRTEDSQVFHECVRPDELRQLRHIAPSQRDHPFDRVSSVRVQRSPPIPTRAIEEPDRARIGERPERPVRREPQDLDALGPELGECGPVSATVGRAKDPTPMSVPYEEVAGSRGPHQLAAGRGRTERDRRAAVGA